MPTTLLLPAILLPTTLCTAAAAELVNFWLAMRIGGLRRQLAINVGDGGDERMMRRMRAQANFGEQTPITLLLMALVELAGRGGWWLPVLAALFILGRIAHGIGMDGHFRAGRPIGMMTSVLLQAVLVVSAVLLAVRLV